ncbi:histidine kinase [Haliscomenobacter sp.]|uniref:sensor histidine kinase n=1 Tax=Haliscomenobacter sp. TaxID=2717303 RepID=UPI0035946AD8
MPKFTKIGTIAAWLFCLCCQLLAQPAGVMPIKSPNGKIWRVTESWFEKSPPLLEFYKFGEQDGLRLQGSAFLLLQDRRGDIWIKDDVATDLIRYDGHQFKYFHPDPNDSTQLINGVFDLICGMVEAPNGWLWVRHEQGFSCYNPVTERFLNFRMQLDSAMNIPLEFFKGREIPSGFFDPVTNRFVKAFPSKIVDGSNPNRSAETVFHWLLYPGWVDSEGNIWSFQSSPLGLGLVCVKPSTGISILYPMIKMDVRDKASSPDYDPWITDMQPDEKGENIWVAGWRGGLRCFNLASKQWTQFTQVYRKEDGVVGVDLETTLFITPTQEGKLWLGTTHGLTLFDPSTRLFSAWWHTEEPGSIAPGNHDLSNALIDQDGRLWVSEGNLMVHDEHRQFIQKTGIKFPSGRKKDVFYDGVENKTWFLKEDNDHQGTGGIYCLDEKTGKIESFVWPFLFDPKIINKVPLNGLTKRGGDIFFVSEYTLYKFNITSHQLAQVKIPPPSDLATKQASLNSLRDISLAPDGSLWISILNAESNISLVHYFPDKNRFEYVRTSAGGLTVSAGGNLFIDRKGRIWLMPDHTTRKGVNCYNPTSKKTMVFTQEPNNPYSLSNNLVNNMAEDQRGRIWMATNSGICWFDPIDAKIHQVTGLSKEYKNITIDKMGNIWVSGDEAAMYNPRTKKVRIFKEQNGMYWAGEILYTRKDGAVCWGPFCRIFPDEIPMLKQGPECRFTGFKIFDREWSTPVHVDFLEKIKLNHTDNTLSIAWSARNFSNPEQDSFYYQLTRMDDDWVAVGSDHSAASYLKLPPGNYIFRLKCKNRDGVFGPEKMLRIRIVPAFYQTIWFKLLIASILLAFVAVIASLRQWQQRLAAELKQKEAEFLQKEAELNQRLSEYQMAALRAQMNPHFIFNSLNSINRFVQMSGPDAASNYLTKFARLIRLVLDNSRSDVITLDNELEAIKLYLELESLRFSGLFEYQLEIDQTIDTEMIKVPPLFIQPYIENAIWHGLMQKEGFDRKLHIELRMTDFDCLNIQIFDNGIGRDMAQEIKSKSATRQKSHGMDITGERLKMFTIRTGKNIQVTILDLKDDFGNAQGTVVKILLEI